MSNTAILIPARLQSKRLPRKLLLPLGSTTVIGQCILSIRSAVPDIPIIVASGDEDILEEAKRHTVSTCRTPNEFTCGSDRIAYVAQQRSEKFLINIQADEVMVNPETIQNLIRARHRSSSDIVSVYYSIQNEEERHRSSVVKVVLDNKNRALYFSRAAIPYHRHPEKAIPGYAHIGMYAYTKSSLLRFAQLEPSPLENQEGLEQLRALEYGMTIEMISSPEPTISIDTPQEYKRAQIRFNNEN